MKEQPTSALEQVTDDFKTEPVGEVSCPPGAADRSTPKTLNWFDPASLEDVASLLRSAVEEKASGIADRICDAIEDGTPKILDIFFQKCDRSLHLGYLAIAGQLQKIGK